MRDFCSGAYTVTIVSVTIGSAAISVTIVSAAISAVAIGIDIAVVQGVLGGIDITGVHGACRDIPGGISRGAGCDDIAARSATSHRGTRQTAAHRRVR